MRRSETMPSHSAESVLRWSHWTSRHNFLPSICNETCHSWLLQTSTLQTISTRIVLPLADAVKAHHDAMMNSTLQRPSQRAASRHFWLTAVTNHARITTWVRAKAIVGSRVVNRGGQARQSDCHEDERLRRVKQPRSSAVTLRACKVIDGTKGIRGVLSAANITAGEQR